MTNIALIGLGPHAKRIYINYIKKYKINLKLIIDLYSKKEEIENFLKEEGFKNTKIYLIKDKYKDNLHLKKYDYNNLSFICEKENITHIIISTEPKAHNMYIEFALKNKIKVLTDKPLTVNKKMHNIKKIKKVKKEYQNLLKLENQSNTSCTVLCQRRYHRGYIYVKKILKEVVEKYQIPITYIDIFHCDGAWELPHDMLKENHPYKYQYGKLFHSGYHFIDLLSDFLKINDLIKDKNKKITKGYVKSETFTPEDELAICTYKDIENIFKDQEIPDYYKTKHKSFKKMGEKNFYGLLTFKNNNNKTITTATLNLLHYGFSRRGWIKTREFYKKNGRVRHERINIEVGTLLNIQIHSYQSKEIKDRTDNEETTGGLEHFDIDIYRNTDIIGGKPFERITLGSLYTEKEKQNMQGYNELSREKMIKEFLKDTKIRTLDGEEENINILTSCMLSTVKHKDINIEIANKNKYIEYLKMYITKINKNEERTLLDVYETNKLNMEYGIILNHIDKNDLYETYLYIKDNKTKEIVTPLLYKSKSNKLLITLYFKVLSLIINLKNIKVITLLNKLIQN